MMDDRERRRVEQKVRAKAAKNARKKTGLIWHVAVFAMVQAAMYAINMEYSPDTRWFIWPLAGWGAAVLLHALATFQGGNLTEQMIEAEVQRELRKRGIE